jgi:putative ABC transport system permease protein
VSVDLSAWRERVFGEVAAARQLVALAWRNVLRHRRRSAIALGAVVFGVVAMLLANGFIDWVLWGMRETTIRSHLGHVQVARAGYRAGGTADPLAFLIPSDAAIRGALEATPHVAVVAPRLAFSGLVSREDATLSFIGEAVAPGREAAIHRSDRFNLSLNITDGADLADDGAPAVILGRGLAENLGAKVGDKVVLLATGRGGGLNAAEVTVAGLFQTVSKAYDDAALRVALPVARALLRVDGDHTLVLLLDDTRRTSAIAAGLQARFAQAGFELTPWYELADFYNKTATLFARQAAVVNAIIAIIIVLSISNTLTMSVLERVGEIGTAMALGVRRAKILRQFLVEGVLLGALGGLAGIVLGVAAAYAISAVGIPMPPPPGMGRGYVAEIMVTPRLALEAFGLAAASTLVASLYPAWKAARFAIVDALRFNR